MYVVRLKTSKEGLIRPLHRLIALEAKSGCNLERHFVDPILKKDSTEAVDVASWPF